MKKGIVAVLLVLVLIVIVSPGIVGKLAENSVDENINWAADQSAEIVVTSQGFDRGWFSSEGQHRVELGDGSLRAALTTFGSSDAPILIIDTRLDHGLIPVSSMSREEGSLAPGLGSAVSTMRVEHGDGESFAIPGTIYSNVALGGDLTSKYVLLAGSMETEDGSATWTPGKMVISANPKSGDIEYEGDFGTLTFGDAEATVTLDSLAFEGEQEKTDYGFFVGDLEFELGEVSVDSESSPIGGLKGVDLTANSSVNDGTFDADALLKIDRQNTPGFGEVSVTADISLSGADAEALGLFYAHLEELSGPQDPMGALMTADDVLQGVMAAGLVFDLKQLDIELPMGTVESRMNLEIPESDPATFAWTSLLLGTVASFDIKVPEALVDLAMQTNPQTATVVGMGYLKKNGDIYEMNAEYKKGLLTINGAPVPIPLGAFQ